MGTPAARAQEKLQHLLGLYPDAPVTLPDPELVFDGLVKQKHLPSNNVSHGVERELTEHLPASLRDGLGGDDKPQGRDERGGCGKICHILQQQKIETVPA